MMTTLAVFSTYLDHSPAVSILREPFLVTEWSLGDNFGSLVNIHLHLKM